MLFTITKVIQTLILPPGGLLLLFLAGAALGRWHRNAGRALMALAATLLYLLSLPLTADLLIRPLESFAKPLSERSVAADAVVVLGSGVRDLSWVPAQPAPSETALARLTAGVVLAKRHRLPLVLAGGSGEIADVKVREADAMARIAGELGMDRSKLLLDKRSRNTLENAAEVRKLMAGTRIILVTSAYHMKRSSAMFMKQGFTVISAPTAFRTETRPSSPANLLPRMTALDASSLALSEYLSLFWYRLAGAI